MANHNPTMSVFAPLTGKVIDIKDVPDQVFAKKTVGDGVAIVPEDGSVFSPISGFVMKIAEGSKHCFVFQTDDGVEIMVHVGLETTKLDGSAFSVYVEEGQRVQAGDLVAEVDLNKLTMAGCNTVTPVIICGGVEGFVMQPGRGHVIAGAGAVFTLEDFRNATPEELAKAEAKADEDRGDAPVKSAEKEEPEEEKPQKAEKKAKAEEEDEKPAAKKTKKKAASASTESAMDFLKGPGGMLKAGLALLVITVLLVACFVSVAMFTMNE